MKMTPSDEVRELFRTIESERRKKIQYAVIPELRSIGKVQVNIHPAVGDATFHVFDLREGLTLRLRQIIREWCGSFVLSALMILPRM
jgi:hypothetical protein